MSPVYGGRATDVFVVMDSGFLNYLDPYDEVMADRGFKIREELMMRYGNIVHPSQCSCLHGNAASRDQEDV